MIARHWFWSRVPERVLTAAARRLWLPIVLESSRRLVEKVATTRLAQGTGEGDRDGAHGAPYTRPAVSGQRAPDPAPFAAPLAPPSERLPTQLYGTPPPAAGVLGHDPLSEEGR